MSNSRISMRCVNCERSVEQVPLISIVHRDGDAHICPQCMPVLIHDPHALAGKLSGVESLTPHEH